MEYEYTNPMHYVVLVEHHQALLYDCLEGDVSALTGELKQSAENDPLRVENFPLQ